MTIEIKKDTIGDDQTTKMYPVLETAIAINPSAAPLNGVIQPAVRYINHSRNASSVSRNAVTFLTPPPNKPDAIDSLLKIIGLRTNNEKSQANKICFVRITSMNPIIPRITFHHQYLSHFILVHRIDWKAPFVPSKDIYAYWTHWPLYRDSVKG